MPSKLSPYYRQSKQEFSQDAKRRRLAKRVKRAKFGKSKRESVGSMEANQAETEGTAI